MSRRMKRSAKWTVESAPASLETHPLLHRTACHRWAPSKLQFLKTRKTDPPEFRRIHDICCAGGFDAAWFGWRHTERHISFSGSPWSFRCSFTLLIAFWEFWHDLATHVFEMSHWSFIKALLPMDLFLLPPPPPVAYDLSTSRTSSSIGRIPSRPTSPLSASKRYTGTTRDELKGFRQQKTTF